MAEEQLKNKINEINTIKDILLGEDIARINRDFQEQQQKLVALNTEVSDSFSRSNTDFSNLSNDMKHLEERLLDKITSLESKLDSVKNDLLKIIEDTDKKNKNDLGSLLINLGTELAK